MTDAVGQIVIVTTDRVLGEVTSFRLQLLGFAVEVSQEVDQVLERLRQCKTVLVIVDLRLEEGEAWRLLDLLGRDETAAHIPVLVMSTDAELDTVQKAFRAGARDYLVLPYDPVVLDKKVEQLLEQSVAGVT